MKFGTNRFWKGFWKLTTLKWVLCTPQLYEVVVRASSWPSLYLFMQFYSIRFGARATFFFICSLFSVPFNEKSCWSVWRRCMLCGQLKQREAQINCHIYYIKFISIFFVVVVVSFGYSWSELFHAASLANKMQNEHSNRQTYREKRNN